MAVEMIKGKHLPLALFVIGVSYVFGRYFAEPLTDHIESLYKAITYCGVFFLVAIPAVGLQFLENKYFWGRFLALNDHLGFLGVSLGLAVGILSLGLW